MATYNGAKFLREQIDSIINQTFKDWTLYICDDGSSDDTIRIIEEYCCAYSNIFRIIKHSHTKGACANFFHLLKSVDSKYYMFSDQDDVWLPYKIETAYNAIRGKRENIPYAVCTDLVLVDTNLNVLQESMWNYCKLRPRFLKKLRYLQTCNILTGCTMLLNRKAKEVSIRNSGKALMHDSWIGLKVLANGGEVVCVETPTILYRQHSLNVLGSPGNVDYIYYLKRLLLLQVMENTVHQFNYINLIKKNEIFTFRIL
ncbi:MAG: glycosyltransferase family 2 protein [Muribaculum sp.]|nr:glycosyltransferase family 2 protein [Muribaculum sp.]